MISKKILSVLVPAVLLVGCGSDTRETGVRQTTTSENQTIQNINAPDSTKKTLSNAIPPPPANPNTGGNH